MSKVKEAIQLNDAIIVKIQRFSIHDGPGIRTTIFLKGCSLRCLWCGNPETQNTNIEILYDKSMCRFNCFDCINVCYKGALTKNDGFVELDRKNCDLCGRCIEICNKEALLFVGKKMSASQIVDLLVKDKDFYEKSGGGITFSGGEPMCYPEILQKVAEECKRQNIHTALDTSGYVNWEVLKNILKYIDLVLYDLKIINCSDHKKLTGVRNTIILENARKINDIGIPVIFRVPLIPDINDSDNHLKLLAEFINSLSNRSEVNLLPYHRLGVSKYIMLGRNYKLKEIKQPKPDYIFGVLERLNCYGLNPIVIS